MNRWLAVLSEAVASISARTGRTLLTALGATLGVGSLVAITGFATTTGAQIASHFDAAASTAVTITDTRTREQEPILGWACADDVRVLGGVTHVGARIDLGTEHRLSVVDVLDPVAAADQRTRLQAVTPSMAEVAEVAFAQGAMFDQGHSDRADRIAVVDTTAADRLGISDITRQRVIFIDSVPYVIAGIYSDADREAGLASSVLIPAGTAREKFLAGSPDALHIRAAAGATRTIAEQAPLALWPTNPLRLQATYTPTPNLVRQQVSDDLEILFLVLGGVSLLGGAVGIMNTMLVSVLERRSEIGLRRAVGARRREVVVQFLAESAGVGLIGGVLGASVGTWVVVVVAMVQQWAPAAAWWVPLVGVALGGLTGILAGAIPAWRASRIEPATALRLG